MEDIIKVCALGGLDENGRDCYVIEINNDIFVLDAGLALPDKTIPGVDFLLTNAQYIISNKDRVKAYIITHAHDENMGALKYFYDDAPAPIICTRFTKHIIETQFNFNKLQGTLDFRVIPPSCDLEIAGRKFHSSKLLITPPIHLVSPLRQVGVTSFTPATSSLTIQSRIPLISLISKL